MSLTWIILGLAAAVALPTVFLLWGGSLLYRALDGDRFVVRGRIRGRWVNRVSRRLLALGLASIVIGSGLCLTAMLAVSGGQHTLWLSAAVAMLTLGIVVIAWSWAGRRSVSQPRCPQCGYDVSAVATLTCPECGFVATTDQMWHKPRKRKRGLVVGGMLTLLAAAILAAPLALAFGWRKLVPTNLMIAGVGWLPETVIVADPARSSAGRTEGSLTDRVMRGDLTPAQYNRLSTKLADRISGADDADELARALTIAERMSILVTPEFTPQSARRFVDRVLLGPASRTEAFDAYAPTIDWTGLGVLGADEAADASRRLRERATTAPPSQVNAVRWAVALEFADDPLPILLDLMRQHQTDRWLMETTPIQAVLQAWQTRPDQIAAPAWEVFLSDPDPATRSAALRVLQLGRTAQAQLSPELADRVLTELVSQATALMSASGGRWQPNSGDAGLIGANINLLLDQSQLDAVADRIRADGLTDRDLVLLAVAMDGVWVGSPKAIDPTLIIGLLGHDRAPVRAAAAQYLANNWHAYGASQTPAELDEIARFVHALEPEESNRELIGSMRGWRPIEDDDE